MISKETKRQFVKAVPIEELEAETDKEDMKEKEEDDKDIKATRLEKRKGVGYDNGGTKSTWSTQDYLALKNKKNERIIILVNILRNILDSKDWIPPQELLEIILNSCILPLVENAFRCSSLLEMAKEKDLYSHYLNLVAKMSTIDSLVPCLMKLDS